MIDGRMTADEAAAHMGITRRTFFNLAGTREDFPKPLHVGRTPLWTPAELDEWRTKHPARRKPQPPT